jgi:Protein phosphatase 2C
MIGRSRRRAPEIDEPEADEPASDEPAATGPLVVRVMHEAIPGNGEDSEPLVLCREDGWTATAVFDGMGGAGGTRYVVDGVERKGAYIASRLARRTTAAVLRNALSTLDRSRPKAVGQTLRKLLDVAFRTTFEDRARQLGDQPTQLRSSLVRTLPTTAAIALAWLRDGSGPRDAALQAVAIWAGDSRVYALDPRRGLMQLSTDDSGGADALQSLDGDPPMDNCVSASAPFELHAASRPLDAEAIVLTATDGCFGYLPTPAHFEFLLVDSLVAADDAEQWQGELTRRIGVVARDDATLAAVSLGSDFAALRARFAARHELLRTTFVEPYERYADAVRVAESAMSSAVHEHTRAVERRADIAQELWARYRTGYEQLLAPRDEPSRD